MARLDHSSLSQHRSSVAVVVVKLCGDVVLTGENSAGGRNEVMMLCGQTDPGDHLLSSSSPELGPRLVIILIVPRLTRVSPSVTAVAVLHLSLHFCHDASF